MRVVAACVDLMLKARLVSLAEAAKAELALVSRPDRFLAEARRGADLLVVDLDARAFEPESLLKLRREDEAARAIPLVGFYSHVEAEVRTRALEAGADAAWPRSKFFTSFGDVLAGRVALSR